MIYIVDVLTRESELVWLPLDVNEIMYLWYVSHGPLVNDFRRLILAETDLLTNHQDVIN